MKDGRTRPLYFSVSRDETYVIHDNRVILCDPCELYVFDKDDAIMLADYDAHESPVQTAAHTIVLASPDESRYHVLLKYRATKFILNPLLKADVIELWRKNKEELPIEEVLERFAYFGGIPRLVFSGIGDTQLLGEMRGSGHFKKRMADSGFEAKVGDKMIFYKFLHMRSIDNTYLKLTHDVVSDYVAERVRVRVKG